MDDVIENLIVLNKLYLLNPNMTNEFLEIRNSEKSLRGLLDFRRESAKARQPQSMDLATLKNKNPDYESGLSTEPDRNLGTTHCTHPCAAVD